MVRKKIPALFLCVSLIVSSCGSRVQEETIGTSIESTEESSESTAESTEELHTEMSSEPEITESSVKESDTEEDGTKQEDIQDTKGEPEAPVYEVISSIYEEINMNWADACMLVLDCVLTTPVSYSGDPVFAALGYQGTEQPLLITGHQNGDLSGNYYIYSFVDGQRIYQLGNYVGIFYENAADKRLCLQVSDSVYQIYEYHSNHMILLETVSSLPEGYSALSMNALNVSPPITVDNLRNYVKTY